MQPRDMNKQMLVILEFIKTKQIATQGGLRGMLMHEFYHWVQANHADEVEKLKALT